MVSKRLERVGRRTVERMSDRQLDRIFGSRPGMRLLFLVMRRKYRPGKTGGFCGEIEFELMTSSGAQLWTVACGDERALARRGAADDPALQVRAKLADFVRVGTGEIDGAAAVLGGKLGVQGDFGIATRLQEIFGG